MIHKHRFDSHQQGFTLLELMIVFAVIAVIAAIALPMYQEYVSKARRSEAAAALMEGVQRLERHYSANGRYTTTFEGNTLAAVFPTRVPASGNAYYNIAAQGTPDSNSYTLRATRAGLMNGDDCGDLEINQAGRRAVQNASRSAEECWSR